MSPESGANVQSFNYERYQRLRERVFEMIGQLPPEYASKIRTDVLVPHVNKSLRVFDNIPSVEEGLTNIKRAYEEKYFKPSSPRIASKLLDFQAATFIESLAEPLLARHISTQDLMKFAIFYDFATGIKYTANTVIMAESSIRGISGFDLINQLDNPNLPTDPIVNTEAALLLDNRAKNAANLLRQDPTGQLLMLFTVQSLEDNSSLLPDFVIQGFCIEGAQYAERAYKIIYPIAERINKK